MIIARDEDFAPALLEVVDDDDDVADGEAAQKVIVLNYKYDTAGEKWVRSTGGGGGWTLVERKTLDANATSVTFSGLNIDADGRYMMVLNLVEAVTACDLFIYANAFSTATSYYTQRWWCVGAAHDAQGENSYHIGQIDDGGPIYGTIMIDRTVNGRTVFMGDLMQLNIQMRRDQASIRSDGDLDNVTSVTLLADSAFQIRSGSIIELWKLG